MKKSKVNYFLLRFVNNLKKLGFDYYNDVKENWIYCGGDGGKNSKSSHLNYYLGHFIDKIIIPPKTNKCLCEHHIVENCYISSPDLTKTLAIGNCCIKRFIKKSGRTCEDCGATHKNRKFNKCNECKIKKCKNCNKKIYKRKDNYCNLCRSIHCITCNKKCSYKYDECYKCKFKDRFNGSCRDCNKKISHEYERCYNCFKLNINGYKKSNLDNGLD